MRLKMKKIVVLLVCILLIKHLVVLLLNLKRKWSEQQKRQNTFKARFETTQGNFDIEAKRAWSPKAVDRLYQLITE